MQKIHVTRQSYEASGPQGHFFEKTKTRFEIWSTGVCVPNFRSKGVAQTHQLTHIFTSEIRNILDQLLASRGGS